MIEYDDDDDDNDSNEYDWAIVAFSVNFGAWKTAENVKLWRKFSKDAWDYELSILYQINVVFDVETTVENTSSAEHCDYHVCSFGGRADQVPPYRPRQRHEILRPYKLRA